MKKKSEVILLGNRKFQNYIPLIIRRLQPEIYNKFGYVGIIFNEEADYSVYKILVLLQELGLKFSKPRKVKNKKLWSIKIWKEKK